jgi:hypothetical protein
MRGIFIAGGMYIPTRGGEMTEAAPEPIEVIRAAHIYGQVKVDLPGPVLASDEVLQSVIDFMHRRIQDRVVPAVEHIVEGERAKVADKPAHAESDLPLNLPSGDRSAHVDCEIVVNISKAAKAEVDQVIEEELVKPVKGFLLRRRSLASARRRHSEEAAKAQFIRAVRSAKK